MATATNPMKAMQLRRSSSGQGGFSLMELMCVIGIASVIATLSWNSVVNMVAGNRLSNQAFELSGVVQQARATAVGQHTFVWVGFYSYSTPEGSPSMMVATVSSNSGMASDLASNNLSLTSKPMIMKGVQVAALSSYKTLPGIDSANNTDVGTQSYSFNYSLPGHSNAKLTNIIAFSPDGQVSLPQSDGSLSLVQCVGMGLNAVPVSTTHPHTAAIQVHGLSGQVGVFQQ